MTDTHPALKNASPDEIAAVVAFCDKPWEINETIREQMKKNPNLTRDAALSAITGFCGAARQQHTSQPRKR